MLYLIKKSFHVPFHPQNIAFHPIEQYFCHCFSSKIFDYKTNARKRSRSFLHATQLRFTMNRNEKYFINTDSTPRERMTCVQISWWNRNRI